MLGTWYGHVGTRFSDSRDPVFSESGTRWWFSLILGSRFSILGTRFGSLEHIKETAITNQKPSRNFFTFRENVNVHESRFLQNSQGVSFGKKISQIVRRMPNCLTFISSQCTELKLRECLLNDNGLSSLNSQGKVELRFAEIMFSTKDLRQEPNNFWMVGALLHPMKPNPVLWLCL